MRMLMITLAMVGFLMPFAAWSGEVISGAVRVIDGDTIDVGNSRIRLYGIDAPESDQTCTTEQGQVWSCGSWVTDRVISLFAGREARCERLAKDKYNRIVARCTVGGVDMGRELVAQGRAFADRRYADDYVLAEKGAAVRDVGLHASRVQNPSHFRQTRAVARMPIDRDCRIKGNISGNGVRIFHQPGQRDYERTGIRTDRGERWFCSVEDAMNHGWRAAKR